MRVGTAELQRAVRAAGFAAFQAGTGEDGAGWLVDHAGCTTPVFLRVARTVERFHTEATALRLLQQQPGAAALGPRLVALLPDLGAGVLCLSYEPGANLADFLPPAAHVPPLPLSYRRSAPAAPDDFSPVMETVGRAVRKMHGVALDEFGLLVGRHPNPHRGDARAFTRQEAHHALAQAQRLGWVGDATASAVAAWLEARLPLIAEAERPCLVHYDLHAGNIRLGRDAAGAWRFRTLLDFELARPWLAEWDLALLSWYLREAAPAWWHAFLRGYGPAHPQMVQRLRLFEMIKALFGVAYSKEDRDWGRWCRARIDVLLAT